MLHFKSRTEFLLEQHELILNNFDFSSLSEFESYIVKIINSLNISYNYIKILGEGGYGVAVDLGDTVLKLTIDYSEVYFADKLLKNNVVSNNLVQILDVCYDPETNIHIIHQEKLITNLNNMVFNFMYYIHKRNPIVDNVSTISDDEVIQFFKSKNVSISDANILVLYNKWKEVYFECLKYDIPVSDFHRKNIGVRSKNPNSFVYFDMSDAYNNYENKLFIKTI